MRGVESLSAVRVTGSVGVFGALGAYKKHVKMSLIINNKNNNKTKHDE